MTFVVRLRYAWHDVRDGWRAARTLGLRYGIRVTWLAGSYAFGYKVRCFGCHRRAHWDPIAGAWCGFCGVPR